MKISKNIKALICLVGCNTETASKKTPEHLPPGYKMLCDGNGHYLPTTSCGTKLEPFHSDRPFSDRKKAIKRAWRQYNYVPKVTEIDTIKWYDCTSGDGNAI